MFDEHFCALSARKMNVVWVAFIRQVERALSGINRMF
jgi:hypothetical protein